MDMPLKPNILDDISKDVLSSSAEFCSDTHVVLALDLSSSTAREIHISHRPRPNHA